MDSPRPANGWALALAVLLLLAFRGALVLAVGDVFFYGDELEKAAAGKAMLDGLGAELGHHRLAYHYYEGGGFVVSHLDALAFLVVGPNLIAVKLVALSFDVLILVAGWSLARRAFGDNAALLFGLLYVLAPESVQKNSLLALGIHWQALLFAVVVLDRGGRIALEGDGSRSNWLLLGLAGGFGTYFNYLVAPALGFAGLALLVLRPRQLRTRASLWGWLGLALGLAPLLVTYALVGSGVFDIHGARLLGGGADFDRWERVGAFLRSVYAGRTAPDLLAVVLVALVPLVGLGFALRAARGPRRWALYLGAYALSFVALYLSSSFVVGRVHHYFLFHRLSQLWLLALLLAAGGLGLGLERGGPARAAAAALAFLLALVGLRGTIDALAGGSTVDLARNARLLRDTKGYRWDHYVDKVWDHLEGDGPARVRALRALDGGRSSLVDYTLAVNLFGPRPAPLADVLREAEQLGLDPSQTVLALGAMWRERYPGELEDRRAAVLAGEGVTDELRPLVEESFGRFGLGFQVREDRLREELAVGRANGFPPAYFRGLGYRLYAVLGDLELEGYWRQTRSPCFVDRDRALAIIGAQPDALIAPMLAGFERAVREHSLD